MQLLLPCKQLKCSCCCNNTISTSPSPSPSFKLLNFNKHSPTSFNNLQQLNEFRHHLRIYTNKVRPDTDYKTLYISQNTTTNEIIRLLVWEKLRLQLRDLNLFYLLMEIRTSTRNSVGLVEIRRNIIQLDGNSNPLELQKCQPEGMSRFILGMENNAILVRVHDGEICPQAIFD
uniref:Ras-associating domain-containing protein n=1 Tax=Meloidogyne floridensis TaxID=298350 RepID=A0A915NYS8_9BILA